MNQGEVCDDIDHGSIMVEVYSQCSLSDVFTSVACRELEFFRATI